MLPEIFRDRNDAHLFGSEPHRECTGEMLDENSDETFERTGHRAVNDYRTVRGVVLTDIGQLEAFRRCVVELNCAELPGAPDGVSDVEVDLRSIERAITSLECVALSRCFERGAQRTFSAIPHFIGA